jgi:hypothetical protein
MLVPEHVTPVHGVKHTELTGPPTPHRQPVTSVFVPRFVDATKSHIAASENDKVGESVGILLGMKLGNEVGNDEGNTEGVTEGSELGEVLGA